MVRDPVHRSDTENRPEVKRMSLAKPSLGTCFHIDFSWWSKNDRDWHVFLRNYLCAEHRKVFAGFEETDQVDWVDPLTAEVTRVDGIQHVLIMHCARQADFITPQTALVDAVFRLFLANGNQPLTVDQLAEMLGRPGQTILRTLTGGQVYKGLRPCVN
jgi:hypothetical protein